MLPTHHVLLYFFITFHPLLVHIRISERWQCFYRRPDIVFHGLLAGNLPVCRALVAWGSETSPMVRSMHSSGWSKRPPSLKSQRSVVSQVQ